MLLYHESGKMSIESKKTASSVRAAFLDILLKNAIQVKIRAAALCANARIADTFFTANFPFSHIDLFPSNGYTIIMQLQNKHERSYTNGF